jgi:hypothetical protein
MGENEIIPSLSKKSIRADVNNLLAHNFWSEQQFETWKGEGAFGPDAQGLTMAPSGAALPAMSDAPPNCPGTNQIRPHRR